MSVWTSIFWTSPKIVRFKFIRLKHKFDSHGVTEVSRTFFMSYCTLFWKWKWTYAVYDIEIVNRIIQSMLKYRFGLLMNCVHHWFKFVNLKEKKELATHSSFHFIGMFQILFSSLAKKTRTFDLVLHFFPPEITNVNKFCFHFLLESFITHHFYCYCVIVTNISTNVPVNSWLVHRSTIACCEKKM